MAKKHRKLPQGVNYAQVLAEEKRKKEAERQMEMKIHAEIFVQRALWLSAVSVADAFGLGPKRMRVYFEKLKENADEFDRMCEETDYSYALEKLREKAQRVSGEEVEYLYEKEVRELRNHG